MVCICVLSENFTCFQQDAYMYMYIIPIVEPCMLFTKAHFLGTDEAGECSIKKFKELNIQNMGRIQISYIAVPVPSDIYMYMYIVQG